MLAVGALALTGVAACGDSDDEPSADAKPAGEAAPGVATARKELAAVMSMPTKIAPQKPLKASPAGKTIDYVECGVDECTRIGDYIGEAAKELGMRFRRISGGNTPESLARAFDQTIANKPDVVTVSGTGRAVFAKQLAKLKQMGIPVIQNGTADRPGGGVAQVLYGGPAFENVGRHMANWVTVDSDGKAKVLLVTAPVFDFAKPLADSYQATLKRNCPDCSVKVMGVSPDDIGKGVPGQIVSYLQKNPDTTHVQTGFGSLMLGVPQAVGAAGLRDKVTLFTTAAGQADYKNVQAGLEKNVIGSSSAYTGWMTADAAARAATGEDPTEVADDAKVPWVHLFTKDKIDWDVDKIHSWQYIPGFRDQFKKLWAQR